jgi:septum formation protein
MKLNIVLASGSPRRKHLLKMIGLSEFKIIPAVNEEVIPAEFQRPEEIVMHLASAKATEVSKKCQSQDLIIAADTIVYIDNTILGKPKNPDEAVEMLHLLSNRSHYVYSGICLYYKKTVYSDFEKTKVNFRYITDNEIKNYVETGEPMDKAGAYGIQGRGALFVSSISGDFYNVMGLPLCKLSMMLNEVGVNIL